MDKQLIRLTSTSRVEMEDPLLESLAKEAGDRGGEISDADEKRSWIITLKLNYEIN